MTAERLLRADPGITEIVRNGVMPVTGEMKTNLMRTAYNMIIYEALDFTTGLFNTRAETVSTGLGLPMFIRTLPTSPQARQRNRKIASRGFWQPEHQAEYTLHPPPGRPKGRGHLTWLRPFIRAREYLQSGECWILALHDIPPDILARLPRVKERIAAVRAIPEASKSAPTRKLAATSTHNHVNVIPIAPFLVIPEVSSERREHAPTGWLEPPTIPSNRLRLHANATLADFALPTSAMHMAWTRFIGGRHKSDYQNSYTTFGDTT